MAGHHVVVDDQDGSTAAHDNKSIGRLRAQAMDRPRVWDGRANRRVGQLSGGVASPTGGVMPPSVGRGGASLVEELFLFLRDRAREWHLQMFVRLSRRD